MLSFVLSVTLVSIPIAVVEAVLLGSIVYFMTNFVVSAGNFFFFLLVLLVVSLAMSAFFRTVAYMVPSMDVAMTIINPITGVQMLYAGACACACAAGGGAGAAQGRGRASRFCDSPDSDGFFIVFGALSLQDSS